MIREPPFGYLLNYLSQCERKRITANAQRKSPHIFQLSCNDCDIQIYSSVQSSFFHFRLLDSVFSSWKVFTKSFSCKLFSQFETLLLREQEKFCGSLTKRYFSEWRHFVLMEKTRRQLINLAR